MKHLNIKSPQYNYLLSDFKKWLDLLGYAPPTVKTLPIHLRELLHYLENNKKLSNIKQVKPQHISHFIAHLKIRPNQNKAGALSSSSINKTIMTINIFAKYLSAQGHHYLDINPRRIKNNTEEPSILSTKEIKALYEASYETERASGTAYGQRDRAMLAIYYGCGIRKNEGTNLDLEDIDLHKALVHVRKGKGGKQRLIPIADKHLLDLEQYLTEGRNWFLEDHSQSSYHHRTGQPMPSKYRTDDKALFLSSRGQRMGESGFYIRLKKLKQRAGIEKNFSLHNLRHSIATHLLDSGMDIEEIQKFLGHSSLESTQLYTHIVNQIKKQQEDEN